MVFQWVRLLTVLQWFLLPAVCGGVVSLDTTSTLSEDQFLGCCLLFLLCGCVFGLWIVDSLWMRCLG